MSKENEDNIAYLCQDCARQPDPFYATLRPDTFINKWVKVRFPVKNHDKVKSEVMWVHVFAAADNGLLFGNLDNDPIYETGLVCGQCVTCKTSEIIEVMEKEEAP